MAEHLWCYSFFQLFSINFVFISFDLSKGQSYIILLDPG